MLLTCGIKKYSSKISGGGFLKTSRVSYIVGQFFRVDLRSRLNFIMTRAALKITFTPKKKKKKKSFEFELLEKIHM